MNEKDLRQKYVDTACSYSGCNEADGSHQLIVDIYNGIQPLPAGYKLKYTDAWCAGFVSAMAKLCGLLAIIPAECSCDRMIAKFKAAGRYQENKDYKAEVGDIIFYDWDKNSTSDHVGIIASVSGLTLKVIEGNISDKVGYRNIVVGDTKIKGFGLPDYASKASGTSSSGSSASNVTDTNVGNTQVGNPGGECEVKLPVLRKGSKGNSVKALQLLLVGNGFSVGKAGVDGDFGTATESALMAYQAKKSLTKDGIAGPATWTALLK